MFDVYYAVNLLIWLLNIYLVTGMWRFFFWLNNIKDKLSCVWFQKRMPFILKFKHYKHFTTNTSSIRGRKIELQYLMHICIDVQVDIIMEMIFKGIDLLTGNLEKVILSVFHLQHLFYWFSSSGSQSDIENVSYFFFLFKHL